MEKNSAEYVALHRRVAKLLPKPEKCQRCLKRKRLDLANKSEEYKDLISDWEWLCRACHMLTDGRISKLKTRNKSLWLGRKECPKCGTIVPRASSKHCSRKCYFLYAYGK